MPQTDASPAYSVPPVERAFALLRHIAGGGTCANVSHTAKALGINRTTLIRLLHTLQAEAMIEPAEGNGWRLGPGLIALAGDALAGRDITRLARPVMQALSETLKLSSHLGILDRREIIYVVREAPNAHLVSNVMIGRSEGNDLSVNSRFLMVEYRRDNQRSFAGAYTHDLIDEGDSFLIRRKKADLVNCEGPLESSSVWF